MTERATGSDDAWTTDEELFAAGLRFAEQIPGYTSPAAYGVARVDEGELAFGHVNGVGGTHLLPAVVLASVCGHEADTARYHLTALELAQAVARLTPAEAATHVEHPNLQSWRELLREARPGSSFVAFFVRDVNDEPVDEWDAQFRLALG